MKALICPTSNLRIDKNIVRITGFLIAVLIAVYTFTGAVYLMVLIAADYFIRAFTSVKFGPVSWLAYKISKAMDIARKSIDKAPKIFAARVGFLFAFTLMLLFFVDITASINVGIALMCFALLESIFDICVGCLVYTHIVYPVFGRTKVS